MESCNHITSYLFSSIQQNSFTLYLPTAWSLPSSYLVLWIRQYLFFIDGHFYSLHFSFWKWILLLQAFRICLLLHRSMHFMWTNRKGDTERNPVSWGVIWSFWVNNEKCFPKRLFLAIISPTTIKVAPRPCRNLVLTVFFVLVLW